ncbi:hypothetical protein GCM10010328_30510 [Streptomyces rubiginosohelvolus]|uniref:Uncharacterized protein n=1 Tax=Streptomyces rubiginosohelvolus TaxID=67362 RepID=A0ABQ3BPM9_9ACTN|nr:hypothetical protein GCM10010328_30510 [Streptomyces pluricolorescens]
MRPSHTLVRTAASFEPPDDAGADPDADSGAGTASDVGSDAESGSEPGPDTMAHSPRRARIGHRAVLPNGGPCGPAGKRRTGR